MSDVIRLENNETESTISNLSNYETDIGKSLTDMSEVMGKLTSCLEGEVADSIAGKFSEYEDQFPFINESIQSYVKDFKNLVTSFAEQDSATSHDDVTIAKKGGDLVNVNN